MTGDPVAGVDDDSCLVAYSTCQECVAWSALNRRDASEVLNFYRRVSFGRGRGGRGRLGFAQRGVNPNAPRDTLDPLLRQLNMRGRGQRDIIAFLQALDDPDFDRTVPARVPSGLEVGGRIGQ